MTSSAWPRETNNIEPERKQHLPRIPLFHTRAKHDERHRTEMEVNALEGEQSFSEGDAQTNIKNRFTMRLGYDPCRKGWG